MIALVFALARCDDTCIDHNIDCVEWAEEEGKCDEPFMKQWCPSSCGLCRPKMPQYAPTRGQKRHDEL